MPKLPQFLASYPISMATPSLMPQAEEIEQVEYLSSDMVQSVSQLFRAAPPLEMGS